MTKRDINTGGGDYREIDNRGQYAERDIFNVRSQPAPQPQRNSTETKLLNAVHTEVEGRLAQSLHERVYVELDLTESPGQVVQPWAVDVKVGNAPSQRCEPGTPLSTIYDRAEIGGKLLVLGAPGSGKTTMLLQLARVLVARAKADMAAPVPVLLNLSAWKSD